MVDENNKEKFYETLNNQIAENDKVVIIVSKEDRDLIVKMIEDRKAIGRVLIILKTLLYVVAGTIVAYNTVFDGIMKGISHFFAGGDVK